VVAQESAEILFGNLTSVGRGSERFWCMRVGLGGFYFFV
jgi:hypothetical protein